MPGTIVNKIGVVLEASTKKFNAGIQKSSEKVTKLAEDNKTLAGSMKNLVNSVKNVNPLLAGMAAAAGAAVGAIIKLTSSTAFYAESLQKLGLRLGLPVEKIEELRFAAEQSGGSLESLLPTLRALARTSSEAADGNELYAATFRKLGVTVTNENGKIKELDTLLEEVADGIATATNSTERLADAQEILGRGATELLPLLSGGSAAIRELREERRSLGRGISQEFADESAEFVDNLNRVKTTVRASGIIIAEEYLPSFNSFLEGLITASQENLPRFVEAFTKGNFILQRFFADIEIGRLQLTNLFKRSPEVEAQIAALKVIRNETFETFKTQQEAAAEERRLRREEEEALKLAENELLAEQRLAAEREAALQEQIGFFLDQDLVPKLREAGEVTEEVGEKVDEALIRPFGDASNEAFDFLRTLDQRSSATFGRIVGFSNRFGDALVDAAENGLSAFDEFLKSILRDLATAIVRAFLLRSLLGALTGGGIGGAGFFKDIGSILSTGALPAPAGGFGGGTQDVAQLVTQSAGGDAAQTPTLGDIELPRPIINVNDSGPLAEIEYVEQVVKPRLRETEEDLGGITRS